MYSYVPFYLLYVNVEQIEREGKDVTVTAFSKMVGYALKVCVANDPLSL